MPKPFGKSCLYIFFFWILTPCRYNLDKYDKDPSATDKVFFSQVDGQSATSQVIGNLQCKRVGAVVQQSIVNGNLYYVCGGIKSTDIGVDGCTMCEAFDVSLGKGATIDVDFEDTDCGGFVVGLKISQNVGDSSDSTNFGWVQLEYTCSHNAFVVDHPQDENRTSGENYYLEVPEIMQTIHKIKTHFVPRSIFSFIQVELKNDHGTFKSFPLNAARIPAKSNTFLSAYGTPSFCFHPDNAAAVMTLKIPTSTLNIQINGLDITAATDNERVTKRIAATGFTCVDGNGVSQIIDGKSKSMGFWNPLKYNDLNYVDVAIEFMTLNQSEYAFHYFGRDSLLEEGNMTSVFGNIRWKMGKTGYLQIPPPQVKWGCTILDDFTVFCDQSISCTNQSVTCTTEYYDDADDSVIQQTEENIANQLNRFSGYITPRELLFKKDQAKFSSFPESFDIVPGVFGKAACDAVRKTLPYSNPVMMLVDTPLLERTSRPHFTESSPTIFVRTSQACHDNSTACHTFSEPDTGDGLKICRHFVGCTKEEFVNITSQATDPPLYECVGFEKCQEKVSSKYTNIGAHAGFRPSCEFVRTCAEPG